MKTKKSPFEMCSRLGNAALSKKAAYSIATLYLKLPCLDGSTTFMSSSTTSSITLYDYA